MNTKLKFLRYLPHAIGILLVLAIGIGVYLLQGVFEKPAQAKKQVQQITVIQPPPPPPPPSEQKPPEPEPEPEQIEEPEPEPEQPQAEETAPSEDLGVDAEGGAGGDAFGLMGKKGGRGLIGGGGGNAVIFYGQHLQQEVAEALHRALDEKARRTRYAVTASIWVDRDGRISRAELSSGTGVAEVDQALRQALANLNLRLKEPPPNMPQPVKIRIRT